MLEKSIKSNKEWLRTPLNIWIRWYIGDTSCPYQVSSRTSERKNRLPDAIGIGVAKAGTGALAFLDCHPKIVFRAYEPNVYPKRCKESCSSKNDFYLTLGSV